MSQNDSGHFLISEENWSLHRKGFDDQQRHQKKVQEAIKNNLPDLVTEESIIMSNGKDVVKIPIRSLDEYKIRYNYDKNKHVGQGDGESQVGDVVARDGSDKKQGPGKGQGAGDQAGEDYYEAEVSLMDLEEALFKELELPNLQQKERDNIIHTDIEFNDIRKTGLTGNIDKKRTMMSAFKRNAMSGKPSFYPIYPEDLKYKTWNDITKPESKAVVLAMMDTSGSMGVWEKYMARSFFFWMTRFCGQNTRLWKLNLLPIIQKQEWSRRRIFSQREKAAEPFVLPYIGSRLSLLMKSTIPPAITFTRFIFLTVTT